MRNLIRRINSLLCGACAPLMLLVAAGWSGQVKSESPAFDAQNPTKGILVEQMLGATIPGDLSFVDDHGRNLFLGQLFDGRRPVLLTLNYSSCPQLCSTQLNHLVEGLRQLELNPGADYQMVTVSIDPKETWTKAAETKQKYVDQLAQPGVAGAWHFLTGKADAIQKLTDAVGFRYIRDKVTGEYYHPAMVAIISPDRTVTSYQLDFSYPPEQLKIALVDAADGRIGSFTDRLPLVCMVYDAERGRYVASAFMLVRLGGLLTIGALCITLFPYWVGKRRSKAWAPLEEPTENVDIKSTPEN